MNLRDDDCYVALKARDARFDGQFFTCVRSTGIYCRPVCPARTPKRANCSFVASAAAAEDAGFRPCLRCRPETAPGSPEWLGSESLVRRALRMMNEQTADQMSLEDLSTELGVSSRQLRRVFADTLGTSPKSIMLTNRVALARQLLVETRLPITDVAMASGFASIRRFNDAIRSTFQMTPTALRTQRGKQAALRSRPNSAVVHLGYRPPYAWQPLLGHFSSRSIAGLESVDSAYVRTVRIGQARGRVHVSNDHERNRLRVEFSLDSGADLTQAVGKVRDLLDIDATPGAIAEHLGRDKRLRRIVRTWPGLRFPGTWSVFEALVRAIVGQQVSVRAARTVLSRLVAEFGEPIETDDSSRDLPDRLFPEPEQLADTTLQPFGLNTARAETINRVAAAFADDPRYIHSGMTAETARKRLLAIKGIGPWTADYVLLRALRYPDAFPAADLGALKAARLDKPKELTAIAEQWRPWRGYALLYLWKMLETEK